MNEVRAAAREVPAVAEVVASWAAALGAEAVPETVRVALTRTLVDSLGLMVAARHQPYIRSVLQSADGGGACTIVGQAGGFDFRNEFVDVELYRGIADIVIDRLTLDRES